MDDDLYDEFGNFIGDANDSDAESASGSEVENPAEYEDIEEDNDESDEEPQEQALVQKDFALRFAGAETIVVDLVQQPEDQPVIKPALHNRLHVEFKAEDEEDLPTTTYSKDYMVRLAKDLPERIRNVAVVGNLHTGKTSFIDALVLETHPEVTTSKRDLQEFKPLRYLDTHVLERNRGMSLFAHPMTLLLPDSGDKSHIINILDSPGHPDFDDEAQAMLDAADGALLVIDTAEGLTKRDKRYITSIVKRNLPIVVVLNKIDRLIIEQRLPVSDFYLKVRYILDDINACIHHNEFAQIYTHKKLISPLEDNVIFASNNIKLSFTLKSFSDSYASELMAYKIPNMEKFHALLWGEIFYVESTRKFIKDKKAGKRSFDHFVLEPIYKLITYSITTDRNSKLLPKILWDNFGIKLKQAQLEKDPQELLRLVISEVFGSSRSTVTLISGNIAPPTPSNLKYPALKDLPDAITVAEAVSISFSADYKSQNLLVKVLKGTLKVGDKMKVVTSGDLDYNVSKITVNNILLPAGRYKLSTEEAKAGMFVYINSTDYNISRPASLFSHDTAPELLKPLNKTAFGKKSVFKVAVEPENPADLPKLLDGLRKMSQLYTSAIIKLEDSGEHVALAPGELYLDCFLHDLRNYSGEYLSIKVSDPMVKFSESCSERSVTKLATYGPSKKTHISITAEPVNDKKLSAAIEKGLIDLSQPQRDLAKKLRNDYGWDALAARSLWVLGPGDMQKPSMLLDDTFDGETDKELLALNKDPITMGFKLGIEEGPLCDEPIRNTKFKILDAVLSGLEVKNLGAQTITMTRNAVHTGFLTAAPRLLEPVYRVNIVCTVRSVQAAQVIIEKRRGWVVSENAIPATQLYELEGFVPVLDSVGLDTDMRLQTQGQAMCLVEFDRWTVVPGDPLDKSVPLPSLKPVPRESMARDFVMKTRKRKGLSGEPNLQKYIDPGLYSRLRESGIID